jgi:hypothetical protein
MHIYTVEKLRFYLLFIIIILYLALPFIFFLQSILDFLIFLDDTSFVSLDAGLMLFGTIHASIAIAIWSYGDSFVRYLTRKHLKKQGYYNQNKQTAL